MTSASTQRVNQRGLTLIELLVGMIIMGIVSTMLLAGWFTLSESYSFSVHSADARDSGRQALARMQREIRDAQKPPIVGSTSSAADAIVLRARAYWIALSTTFNEPGNSAMGWTGTPAPTPSPTKPHLVVYRLYRDKTGGSRT